MAVKWFRRSYGSLRFAYIRKAARSIRRSLIAIADMAIATRVQESARSYLSALLLCVLACLLVACGSGGGGGGGGGSRGESADSSSPKAVVLTWDAVPVQDVGGYRVYYGTSTGTYIQSFGHGVNAGNVTIYAVTGLSSRTRYNFVITAYDTAGNESAYSNEVFKDIP